MQGLAELCFSLGNFFGPPIGGGLVEVREYHGCVLQLVPCFTLANFKMKEAAGMMLPVDRA